MPYPELEELYNTYRTDLYRYLCHLNHDPAGVHAGESLGSGGQAHHHGGGHLDGHFHLVQIRELRL